MINVAPLTKTRCLDIACQIEGGFARFAVTIHPQSDVGLYIREMRWLAEHLDGSTCPPGSHEHNRAVEAILIVDQAANVAATFAMLARTEIPNMKVQILKKRLNRFKIEGNAKARDILFELEVAGRVARFPEMHVAFEEPPDIVIRTPGSSIAIACKKVTSLRQISKQISEAANQGERSRMPFFIFVDVGELTTPRTFVCVESEDELARHYEQQFSQIMPVCSDGVLRAFQKGAGGVVLCCRVVGMIKFETGQVAVRWYFKHHRILNFGIPDAAATLSTLVELMEMRGLSM